MTLKPQLIRADTLDLQDHNTPSAQDHGNTPQPAALGAGPAAPHQEQTLRDIDDSRTAEQDRLADPWGSGRSSGRSSHEGSELLDQDLRMSADDTRIDDTALQQDDDETSSTEGEGSEMMDDRLSSSPSIGDSGGYYSFPRLRRSVSKLPLRSTVPTGEDAEEPSVVNEHKADSAAGPSVLEENHHDLRPQGGIPAGGSLSKTEADPWDLFEPEGTCSPLSSIRCGCLSTQQTSDDEGWPLPATRDDVAWEKNHAPGLENASAEDSDWEDIVDDSSDLYLEEIDPDFVYALHNFVATVEGQANAAKGDSMVLLDDTNSYWWLVRLVKDSSIGYLPAEHIELPVERVARQNKHRNLELARTFLSDQDFQTKNPLKRAFLRRHAKKVDFSTPTFYEASEVDYSDDENGTEQDELMQDDQAQQQDDGQSNERREVDARSVNGEDRDYRLDSGFASAATSRGSDPGLSQEESEEGDENGQKTTRGGTIRNTDSFFGDDSAEPRKISLTPNLLRDESGEASGRSSGSTDKGSASQDFFNELEKPIGPEEKAKSDKQKKKEKKPGMLSGLFKRKDKKIKVDEAAGGIVLKQETEPTSPRSPTSTTGESSPVSATSPTSPQVRRSTSAGKLTKQPPPGVINPSNNTPKSPAETNFTPGPELSQTTNPVGHSNTNQPQAQTLPEVSTSTQTSGTGPVDESFASSQPLSAQTSRQVEAPNQQHNPPVSYGDRMESSQAASDRQYVPPSVDALSAPQGIGSRQAVSPVKDVPDLQRSRAATNESNDSSSRTVSPPSPVEQTLERSGFPSSTERNVEQMQRKPEWDNAALRRYLDERSNQDAKDMLLLVGDTRDVKPLPLDHPTMLGFGFHEQQRQLNDMSRQLDSLLNGFLARKAARPKVHR